MHTQKTAMTTNDQYVAARLAGVGVLEVAHAGKPDYYGYSVQALTGVTATGVAVVPA